MPEQPTPKQAFKMLDYTGRFVVAPGPEGQATLARVGCHQTEEEGSTPSILFTLQLPMLVGQAIREHVGGISIHIKTDEKTGVGVDTPPLDEPFEEADEGPENEEEEQAWQTQLCSLLKQLSEDSEVLYNTLLKWVEPDGKLTKAGEVLGHAEVHTMLLAAGRTYRAAFLAQAMPGEFNPVFQELCAVLDAARSCYQARARTREKNEALSGLIPPLAAAILEALR